MNRVRAHLSLVRGAILLVACVCANNVGQAQNVGSEGNSASGTQPNGATRPAQSGSQPANAAGIRRVRKPPQLIGQEVLRQMPATLPIPTPADAKFMAGYRDQYSTTKATTEIRLKTNNTAAAVSDWYKQSLTSAGWTVSAGQAGGPMTAYKGKLFCTLNFLQVKPPFGSSSAAPSTNVLVNFSGDR